MTVHLNRQVRGAEGENRRPAIPLGQQSGSLFLGWGPKI
jgi:hypothetical protein